MQLRVMELTGALVPQGALVKGVKTGWRLAWRTLMSELAPQSKDGEYVRSFRQKLEREQSKQRGGAAPSAPPSQRDVLPPRV